MHMKKIDQTVLWVLLAGVGLRILFMALFIHPDLKSQYFHGQFLSQGVGNIYKFLSEKSSQLPYRDSFNYPVLTYYFLGSWEWISKLWLGPGLETWLADWGPNGYHPQNLFSILLTLKIPYLIADLFLLQIMWSLLYKLESKKILAYIWAFNPISLYAIFMIGQFDILPALLCMIAFWAWAKHQKLWLACLMLSLAAGLKTYPLLILPFLFLRIRNWKDILGVGLTTAVGIALMFTQPNTGLIQRIFLAGVDIGYDKKILLFPLIYIFGLIISWSRREEKYLWFEFLLVPLLTLSLSHFNPQWVIWSWVFIMLLVSKNWQKFVPATALFTIGFFATIFFIADKFIILGMFTGLSTLVDTIPAPIEMFAKGSLVVEYGPSIAASILAAASTWILYQTSKKVDYEA